MLFLSPFLFPSSLFVVVEVSGASFSCEFFFFSFFPFSWPVPAPLAVWSCLLFSVSASLQGQMHTNAFRSPQDKAWKGLPHGKNVSSPISRMQGLDSPLCPTPGPTGRAGDLRSRSLALFVKLGAGEQPWHPPLVSSICKTPCLKGSLLPADLSDSLC